MHIYAIHTGYREPRTGSWWWETTAPHVRKAVGNIRARLHYGLGIAWCEIDITQFTVKIKEG